MRHFETGATRDRDDDKFDFEGFLSPLVLLRFAEYMHKHRQQADGELRDSDNWQKGIPCSAYMKSMYRHFIDVWLHHRNLSILARDILQEALCGLLFNVMGYLHEVLREEVFLDKINDDPNVACDNPSDYSTALDTKDYRNLTTACQDSRECKDVNRQAGVTHACNGSCNICNNTVLCATRGLAENFTGKTTIAEAEEAIEKSRQSQAILRTRWEASIDNLRKDI